MRFSLKQSTFFAIGLSAFTLVGFLSLPQNIFARDMADHAKIDLRSGPRQADANGFLENSLRREEDFQSAVHSDSIQFVTFQRGRRNGYGRRYGGYRNRGIYPFVTSGYRYGYGYRAYNPYRYYNYGGRPYFTFRYPNNYNSYQGGFHWTPNVTVW